MSNNEDVLRLIQDLIQQVHILKNEVAKLKSSQNKRSSSPTESFEQVRLRRLQLKNAEDEYRRNHPRHLPNRD